MSFRLRTCTQLAALRFEAAILLILSLLPLGVALLVLVLVLVLVLANPSCLQLAQMTAAGCVTIVLGYMPHFLGHRFKSKATRIRIDATAFRVVVEPDLAVLLVGKRGF